MAANRIPLDIHNQCMSSLEKPIKERETIDIAHIARFCSNFLFFNQFSPPVSIEDRKKPYSKENLAHSNNPASSILGKNILEDFTKVQLEMCRLFQLRTLVQDEIVFFQGDKGDNFYFIVSGSVTAYRNERYNENEDFSPFEHLKDGSLFEAKGFSKTDLSLFGNKVMEFNSGDVFGEEAILPLENSIVDKDGSIESEDDFDFEQVTNYDDDGDTSASDDEPDNSMSQSSKIPTQSSLPRAKTIKKTSNSIQEVNSIAEIKQDLTAESINMGIPTSVPSTWRRSLVRRVSQRRVMRENSLATVDESDSPKSLSTVPNAIESISKHFIEPKTAFTWTKRLRNCTTIANEVTDVLFMRQQDLVTIYASMMQALIQIKQADSPALTIDPSAIRIIWQPERLRQILQLDPMQRTERDLEFIFQSLRQNPWCYQLPESDFLSLCRHIWYRKVDKDRVLFRQDEPGNEMFVIIQGSLFLHMQSLAVESLEKKDSQQDILDAMLSVHIQSDEIVQVNPSPNHKTRRRSSIASQKSQEIDPLKEIERCYGSHLCTLIAGDALGETSLNCPGHAGLRNVTAYAAETLEVLVIPKDSYLSYIYPIRSQMLFPCASIQSALAKPFRERTFEEFNFLRILASSMSFFQQFPDEIRSTMADSFQLESFSPEDIVICQDDVAKEIFVIFSGLCSVWTLPGRESGRNMEKSQKDDSNERMSEYGICVGYLYPGDAFGNLAFHHPSKRRSATVVAVQECKMLTISRTRYLASIHQIQIPIVHAPSRCRQALQLEPSQRSPKDVEFIMESCQRVSFFGQLPSWLVKKLCANAEYIQYQPGAIIFREGENGACLYIIFSGSVSIHKAETGRKSSIIHNFRTRRSHTKAGEFITDVRELKDRVHVERYGKLLSCLTSGDSFGEMALRNAAPRSATAVCREHVELIVIHKKDFDMLMKSQRHVVSNPALCRKLLQLPSGQREESDIRHLLQLLRTLRFFQQVSPQVQKQLCQVMTYKQFERGEVVFYQDDAATDFYIVLSGSFQVRLLSDQGEKSQTESNQSQENRHLSSTGSFYLAESLDFSLPPCLQSRPTHLSVGSTSIGKIDVSNAGNLVATLYPGDSFGERGLNSDAHKRTATVISMEKSEIIVVSGNHYEGSLYPLRFELAYHPEMQSRAISNLMDSEAEDPQSLPIRRFSNKIKADVNAEKTIGDIEIQDEVQSINADVEIKPQWEVAEQLRQLASHPAVKRKRRWNRLKATVHALAAVSQANARNSLQNEEDGEKKRQSGQSQRKNRAIEQLIHEMLQKLSMYKLLPQVVRERIVKSMHLERYSIDDIICRAGDQAMFIYTIISGCAQIYQSNTMTQTIGNKVATLKDGESYGDFSCRNRHPCYLHTLKAAESCHILALPRQDYLGLITGPWNHLVAPDKTKHFQLFVTTSIFSALSLKEKEALAFKSTLRGYPRNAAIPRTNSVYLIVEGECKIIRMAHLDKMDTIKETNSPISHSGSLNTTLEAPSNSTQIESSPSKQNALIPIEVAILGPGGMFSEDRVLGVSIDETNADLQETLIAVTNIRLLRIKKKDLESCVRRDALKSMQLIAKQRLEWRIQRVEQVLSSSFTQNILKSPRANFSSNQKHRAHIQLQNKLDKLNQEIEAKKKKAKFSVLDTVVPMPPSPLIQSPKERHFRTPRPKTSAKSLTQSQNSKWITTDPRNIKPLPSNMLNTLPSLPSSRATIECDANGLSVYHTSKQIQASFDQANIEFDPNQVESRPKPNTAPISMVIQTSELCLESQYNGYNESLCKQSSSISPNLIRTGISEAKQYIANVSSSADLLLSQLLTQDSPWKKPSELFVPQIRQQIETPRNLKLASIKAQESSKSIYDPTLCETKNMPFRVTESPISQPLFKFPTSPPRISRGGGFRMKPKATKTNQEVLEHDGQQIFQYGKKNIAS